MVLVGAMHSPSPHTLAHTALLSGHWSLLISYTLTIDDGIAVQYTVLFCLLGPSLHSPISFQWMVAAMWKRRAEKYAIIWALQQLQPSMAIETSVTSFHYRFLINWPLLAKLHHIFNQRHQSKLPHLRRQQLMANIWAKSNRTANVDWAISFFRSQFNKD